MKVKYLAALMMLSSSASAQDNYTRIQGVLNFSTVACLEPEDYDSLEILRTTPHEFTNTIRGYITDKKCGVLPKDLQIWIDYEDVNEETGISKSCIFVQEDGQACFWVDKSSLTRFR